MTPWLVPGGDGSVSFTEKRSRFLGRVWRCDDEDQALARIAETKKQYYDATHNVWAYVLRDGPVRYSDDGEPGGTAGAPTLAALQRQELFNVCCVVTRYFGGILLGSGGLVRAYSRAAAGAATAAGRAEMRLWTVVTVPTPYPLLERLRQQLLAVGGQELDAAYGEAVLLRVCVPEAAAETFLGRVTELSSGQVCAAVTGQQVRAFPIS